MLQSPAHVLCPSCIPEEDGVNQTLHAHNKERRGYSLGAIILATAFSYVLYYCIYTNARQGFFLKLALKFVKLS